MGFLRGKAMMKEKSKATFSTFLKQIHAVTMYVSKKYSIYYTVIYFLNCKLLNIVLKTLFNGNLSQILPFLTVQFCR